MELLSQAAKELIDRGLRHDSSKFDPEEAIPLAQLEELIRTQGPAPYGSELYIKRTKMIEPMVRHHYQHNTHHPEHWNEGIDGMNLFDIIEMVLDWQAATERNKDDAVNVSYSVDKYSISPQLENIIRNTYAYLDFPAK
jgi:hypothetical protein